MGSNARRRGSWLLDSTARACVNCRKAHVRCDMERPCWRCKKLGIPEEECVDCPAKKMLGRGRPKRMEESVVEEQQVAVFGGIHAGIEPSNTERNLCVLLSSLDRRLSSQVGVVIFNGRLQHVKWNNHINNIWGYSNIEFKGMHSKRMNASNDKTICFYRMMAACQENKILRKRVIEIAPGRVVGQRRDGSVFEYLFKPILIFSSRDPSWFEKMIAVVYI